MCSLRDGEAGTGRGECLDSRFSGRALIRRQRYEKNAKCGRFSLNNLSF